MTPTREEILDALEALTTQLASCPKHMFGAGCGLHVSHAQDVLERSEHHRDRQSARVLAYGFGG